MSKKLEQNFYKNSKMKRVNLSSSVLKGSLLAEIVSDQRLPLSLQNFSFKSLLNRKIYELKKGIKLLNNVNEKKSDPGKKDETDLKKLKVEFQEKGNNSMKNEINRKLDLVDLILEHS